MANFWKGREAIAISSYWNAVTDGQPWHDRAANEIDSTLLDTIARIQEGRERYVPDPDFVDRLETKLMNTQVSSIAVPPPRLNKVMVRPDWVPTREMLFPRRWSLAAVATVGLIAVTIAIFFFSLRGSDQPAVVPATPVVAPTSTSAPAPTATVVPVTMFRGGLERTGVMPGPAPSGQLGVLWRADAGAAVKGPIAVGNGLVFNGSDNGSVHAFDMATGAEVWKLTGTTGIESPSSVLDGATAYIAGYDGMVLAVDAATGAELWRTDPALNVSRRVAVDAATKSIYVGGLDSVSYAFDSTTGQLKWQTELRAPQSSVASVVAGDTLYFGVIDGLLYALNTADGSIRWTYDSALDGYGALTFANNTIFGPAGDKDTAFVAVDAGTGAERWRITTGAAPYSAAAILDGNLFIGTELGEMMSLSATDGQVNWTVPTGNGVPIWTAPSIVGDDLYAVDTEGWLYALDAATGQEMWRVKLDGGINYNPAITGGVIYVGAWSGSVYALGDGGTELPVATPVAGSPIPADASPEAKPAVVTSDAVELLWETSGGPTPLLKSGNATIAPDGNVWVADGGHSQFQIFSPDGTFIEAWGTPGSDDGQFNFTRPASDGDAFGAVAFAPDGSFYVADMGNRRIQHFAADRTFLHAWGSLGREDGQFISPIDIAVDSQGNVFVDDDKRNDVQKFAADGTFLLKFGGFGSGPGQLDFQCWMTIDGEDNVWVADCANRRIQAWANDGTFLREVGLAGTLGDPWVIAFDEQGHLYVLDNKGVRVVVLDSSYAIIASWDLVTSRGQPLTTMNSLAVDGEGGMYVTDYLESVLIKYQLGAIPDGTPTP